MKGEQVVHYVGLDQSIPDKVSEVAFNRKIVYDKVTKKKLLTNTWQPERVFLSFRFAKPDCDELYT